MNACLLGLALAALKVDAPLIEAPKIRLELPGAPRAEGLREPAAQGADLAARPTIETDTLRGSPVHVEQVQISRSFTSTPRGLKATQPVDSFVVAAMPVQLPVLKVCVRVSSPDRMPARIRVQLRLPGGGELATSSRHLVFDTDWVDALFELPSLTVTQAGTYRVVVSLDGTPAAELPLEIRELKQRPVVSRR